MSPSLNRQMMRMLDELEFRADLGVLILSGEGDAWSAGINLQEHFREIEKQGLGAGRGAQRDSTGSAASGLARHATGDPPVCDPPAPLN